MPGIRGDLYGSIPGQTTANETYENAFRWGRDGLGVIVGAQLDGTTRDAGNTPTTVLRPGLVLGPIGASGNLRDYGDANVDGSNQVTGILMSSFRMVDLDGNNTPRFVWILVAGPVRPSKLFGFTEQARGQMAGRFLFDDRNYSSRPSGIAGVVAKVVNYTVLVTDTGTVFTTTGAVAEVDFTLPVTPTRGFDVTFMNTVGQTMKVIAPAGLLIAFNNLAATSVALSTAGNLIGSGFRIIVNDAATKYVALPIGGGTVTVA